MAIAPVREAAHKKRVARFVTGAALALLGIALAEAILFAGLRPLSPLGWPGVGVLAGAAIGGGAGLAGASLVAAGYYVVNFGHPHRFPEFYGSAGTTVSWVVALAILSAAILMVRPRLLRAAANEAELAARRRFEDALRESEARLRMERERLEAALDGSSVALWDTDLRSRRVYLSDAWSEIVGAAPGETVTTVEELEALMHPEEREMARRLSLEVMKGTRAMYAIEHRVRARNGEWKWIISRGRVTERDPASGRALRMIGTNVDITDRRRMEEAIQSAAQSDPLTGLANRATFGERLKLAAARSRRHGSRLAVLYLDIDRFKQVNDSMGHAAGDALLKDFAGRLRAVVRATDSVARFGGDEFVVLLEDLKDREAAVRVAEKILLEGRRLLRIEGRSCVATTSIGIAYGEGGVEDERMLLKRADEALYAAKAAGRDCHRVAEGS